MSELNYCSLLHFPLEINIKILSELDIKDLLNISLVSKYYNYLIEFLFNDKIKIKYKHCYEWINNNLNHNSWKKIYINLEKDKTRILPVYHKLSMNNMKLLTYLYVSKNHIMYDITKKSFMSLPSHNDVAICNVAYRDILNSFMFDHEYGKMAYDSIQYWKRTKFNEYYWDNIFNISVEIIVMKKDYLHEIIT